jgi:hypothetical protein
MKKITLSLIFLSLFFLNCRSLMPTADTGYVITKDKKVIEFQNARMYDDGNAIYIIDKYSTHTLMKRDIKEIHMIFNNKDYVFNH